MIARTGEKHLSTPAAARAAARWAITTAAIEPNGSFYALLTARVFTAFMFEGVVHHLGETLCPVWGKPRPRSDGQRERPPLERQSVEERHKVVRRLLRMHNGGTEYQAIRMVVGRIVLFRDRFAHPKAHQQTVKDYVESELARLPDIDWEAEITMAQVESDYQQVEEYCTMLLNVAADLLEEAYTSGWDVWRQRYPHLPYLRSHAGYLRVFLHCRSHASLDYGSVPRG